MDEEIIKALSKNLSMFFEHAPMKPPNADGMTPLDEWTAYLTAWVSLYEKNKECNTDNTGKRLFCIQACSNCNLSLDECRQIGGVQ